MSHVQIWLSFVNVFLIKFVDDRIRQNANQHADPHSNVAWSYFTKRPAEMQIS